MHPVYTARHDGAEIATIRTRHGPWSSRIRLTGYNVRMAFRLTPHERGFYPLFTRAAENIAAAADELAELVAADAIGRQPIAAAIKELEHMGDDLTHAIMVKLNRTFVTPFDREDIYRLASALDDVIDAIEEAADRIVLYRLDDLPAGIAEQ